MTTIFTVKYATNGVVIEVSSPDEPEVDTMVYQDDGDNEKKGWAAFLRQLTEMYGPGYNKWGKEEITIDIRPGHKCDTSDDVAWFLEDLFYTKPTPEQVDRVCAVINSVYEESQNESHDDQVG